MKIKIQFTVDVPEEIYEGKWPEESVILFMREGIKTYGADYVIKSLKDVIEDDEED